MVNTALGLEEAQLKATKKTLNQLLSDEFVLTAKTLCAHWNIHGAGFRSRHLLLDEQYHTLIDICDSIAERVRALGGRALGSLHGFHENTRLKEFDEHKVLPDAKGLLSALVDDHEAIVRELRLKHDNVAERQHDVATMSLMEDLILQHEKMAWFLRSEL